MNMRERKTAHERGYGWQWQKIRRRWLMENPLCKFCADAGRVTAASVVDHIVPHKGDQNLFWDENNWQSLCKPCHDSLKQQEERRGYSSAVGLDGWPTDERHPVNRHGGVSKK